MGLSRDWISEPNTYANTFRGHIHWSSRGESCISSIQSKITAHHQANTIVALLLWLCRIYQFESRI